MASLLYVVMLLAADVPVVKITPLGSHAGEFCRNDRALLFEDPTGCACFTTRDEPPRAGPNRNLADIVAAKNSAFIADGEMADYFAYKVQDITGSPTASCAAAGLTNEFVVPLSAPCTATLGPDEGVFVAQHLVKPQTVIPPHINEAATRGGVAAGQRMQRFL
jgi:hypothetical protein